MGNLVFKQNQIQFLIYNEEIYENSVTESTTTMNRKVLSCFDSMYSVCMYVCHVIIVDSFHINAILR